MLIRQVESPPHQLWATVALQDGLLSQKGKLLEGSSPRLISTRTSHRPDQTSSPPPRPMRAVWNFSSAERTSGRETKTWRASPAHGSLASESQKGAIFVQ
jgi:hypothetical protein